MTLTTDQARALRLLDETEPRGCTKAVMTLAHGFKAELLAGLGYEGLASMVVETITAGDQPIEVARLRITAAGRRALAPR
jgi:hypothetical protein